MAWAGAAGMLPANAQALMYDRLTPLGRNVSDATLIPSPDGSRYFKSAKLLAPDDPSLITDETISSGALTARIRRDVYGVPHIYSDTDDGVLFGAGYVVAADRNLLLDQARDNGIAAAIDVPDAAAIRLALGLFDYQPTARIRAQVTRQQDAALKAAGPAGRQVLRDIDTYLVGVNKWYAANRPDARPFDRADVYALNAIKSQFLGQGERQEIENALFYDAARDRLGRKRGSEVYEDLRPVQRELPQDGARQRRHDREGRRQGEGALPPHRARPVVGYARIAGTRKIVALSQRRASAGRETTDQIFFQQLTFGRVHSAAGCFDAASTSPQTFNALYASDREIAPYTTGRLPIRPRGVNGDLPVDGRGGHEWKGYLPASRHPQDVNPSSGLLVSWNNKPAKDFPAGDERWDEGGTQRVDWLLKELSRTEKHTPATVLGAVNAAATADRAP